MLWSMCHFFCEALALVCQLPNCEKMLHTLSGELGLPLLPPRLLQALTSSMSKLVKRALEVFTTSGPTQLHESYLIFGLHQV